MVFFIEDAQRINIKKILAAGLLEPGKLIKADVTFGNRGSLQITSNTRDPRRPFVEFDYEYNGEPVNYRVYFTQVPSNLEKGFIWYFICPVTGKRCRELLRIGKMFLHREAYKDSAMYKAQAESKSSRAWAKMFAGEFHGEHFYREIHKPYFKKHYAGKLTRRYRKLLDKLPEEDIQRLKKWKSSRVYLYN